MHSFFNVAKNPAQHLMNIFNQNMQFTPAAHYGTQVIKNLCSRLRSSWMKLVVFSKLRSLLYEQWYFVAVVVGDIFVYFTYFIDQNWNLILEHFFFINIIYFHEACVCRSVWLWMKNCSMSKKLNLWLCRNRNFNWFVWAQQCHWNEKTFWMKKVPSNFHALLLIYFDDLTDN